MKLYTTAATAFKTSTATAALLLLPAMLRQPASEVNACLPSDRSYQGYTFLDTGVLSETDQQTLQLLLSRFDQLYYHYFQSGDQANRDENLAEWLERFCGDVEPEDLQEIIYTTPARELELLLSATQSKTGNVPVALADNSAAEFIFEKKCTETAAYLLFAKHCEPHVVAGDPWESPQRDKAAMRGLIAEGLRQFKRTKSDYIRLRYAYQIVRLAHYAGYYEDVLAYCEDLLPKIDKERSRWGNSILPWWIEGHRAGALRQIGNYAEAAYRFALVFQHCPGRRGSALQSFFIRSDEEWLQCLRLCQSDAERATLYALRAAGAESKALEDLQKIYEIDPENEHLEVLLFQEIRKMERSLLGLEFNSHRESNKRYYKLPRPYAARYITQLQAFARKARQEEQVRRPELWLLAEGYLEMLAGDYYAAAKTFGQAERSVDDEQLEEQLQIMQTALQIAAFRKASPEAEAFAYDMIKENELYKSWKSFPDFLRDKMSWLYHANQQEGNAFLCQRPLSELKPNPLLDLLDDLIATATKEDPSPFERLLMENNPANDILDLKATLLLGRGEIEAALETYKRIPAARWDDYGQFNPFRETFRDCISCYQRSDTLGLSSYFNRGELMQELLDLEYKARGDLEGAATHYYRLGLAWYNMSYFGYAWHAADQFRSGSTWSHLRRAKLTADNGYVYEHPLCFDGNRENTSLYKAHFYFEKALNLARSRELAARAAFQMARCEQKIFFQTPAYKPAPGNRIPRLPAAYLAGFDLLKSKYGDTEFYEMIVKECKYFEAYAAR
ncbi:MAG: hypothetical protein RI973_618 [Bacteroidota bacterium]|jgi:hypothetical protein